MSAGMLDEVEEIAAFARCRVLPASDLVALEMDVERVACIVVDIANLPVVAGLPAGREVLAADRFGMRLEQVRELAGR